MQLLLILAAGLMMAMATAMSGREGIEQVGSNGARGLKWGLTYACGCGFFEISFFLFFFQLQLQLLTFVFIGWAWSVYTRVDATWGEDVYPYYSYTL
ncbi:hypothetical protein DFH27DRAFT_567361 [Peziza echinospora]|nr:hypothetical protein DFH27DRAFT_567361 [Peziza echinospora]